MLRYPIIFISLAALIGAGSCATKADPVPTAAAAEPQSTGSALRGAATEPTVQPASQPTTNVAPRTIPPEFAANMSPQTKFNIWKNSFIDRAVGKGYDADLVQNLIGPAKINEKALDRDSKQPEFTKPIWSYVDGAASADRLNKGRSKLSSTSQTFDAIEKRYQVSRHYLTSIWGLESAYGAVQGSHNIVDALATFAHDGRRQQFGENQLFAILDLISRGDLRQDQLTGSWAGAMGMTQFIPTTMRDYAVDFDGNGNIDMRGSLPQTPWLAMG